MLQTHEMRLENLKASTMVELSNSIANFAQNISSSSFSFRGNQNNSQGRYNRGRGRTMAGGGRGYNQFSNYNKPLRQICNKVGHRALKCFYRFDLRYQNYSQSQQAAPTLSSDDSSASVLNSQAYIATPQTVNDTTWFLDSGATHHITSDETP